MDSNRRKRTAGGKNDVRMTAVILAAGQGKRMNSSTAKQYLLLRDKPVLYYSLKAFQDSPVDEMILVTGAGETEYVRREIVEKYGFYKVSNIVEGGKERFHSVANGLEAISQEAGRPHYCLIHDGARPFVTQQIIRRAMDTVIRENACVVGMPVKDTIKIADNCGYISDTPKRSLVWQIQTPQVFALELIRTCYRRLAALEGELTEKGIQVTDDASVVELFTECKVKLVEGSYENIKITTPEDLKVAEALLRH